MRHETRITAAGDGDLRAQWIVHGEMGSVEFWFELRVTSEISSGDLGAFRATYGGVEIHSRVPFRYSGPEPSHEYCSILDAPCWHDGSSFAAYDLFPGVAEGDGAAVWAYLERRTRDHDEEYSGGA